MIPYHQEASCSSKNDSKFHDYFNNFPKILYNQPSLPSVPSLTSSQSDKRNCYFPTAHHRCMATLKGQNSYPSSLALAGKFLYAGSSDKEIRLWKCNSLTSDHEVEIEAHDKKVIVAGKGAVKCLVVLADKIFSAHQDNKIRVWKIDDQQENNDHLKKFTHMATLPTLSDRAFKLLIPKNQVEVRRHKKCTWVHHVDTVSSLALSSDNQLLYSVSWDRTIKIWRTIDFKCLESVLNAHDDAINSLALSEDGRVYTGSTDKKIKVWRKSCGEKQHTLVDTLEKHKSGVNALALSADGSVLYSGACDRSILVWEKEEDNDGVGGRMVVVGALRGHSNSILCLALVSDFVCSGSADKTVRIWRGFERCYSCVAVLEGHKGPIKCLALASDQHYCNQSSDSTTSSYLLYSGSLDCDIKVWKILVPSM